MLLTSRVILRPVIGHGVDLLLKTEMWCIKNSCGVTGWVARVSDVSDKSAAGLFYGSTDHRPGKQEAYKCFWLYFVHY